ncbi:MAG: noncanonical pyrimidine nucleotidase, YjjG family [Bacteroidetes bacterium]|nr:noncanonical pyrimidine nucleotidase, YjjG family [Bacteroidota bacterium]
MDSLKSSDRKSRYEHIFFDLDHTLWDFETNSRETLSELYHEHKLESLGAPAPDEFISSYEKLNADLWHQYRNGEIDRLTLRNTRFVKLFAQWEIENQVLCDTINEQYLSISPLKTHLIPNAIEILEYLKDRYPIHIITNGFREVQYTKLHRSGLMDFFEHIITSEEAGFLKPDKRVFEAALMRTNSLNHNSIYIGDHYETDVIGSRNAGIDSVHFSPEEVANIEREIEPNFIIRDLIELKEIF